MNNAKLDFKPSQLYYYFVLTQWSTREKPSMQKGVRQGDLMSPYCLSWL
jgi:hypothetical protein